MKHLTFFLACLALLPLDPLSAAPLQQNGRRESGPTPVAELPAHIKAVADRVSLIADFDHKASGALVLYLINTTDADVSLDAQDGDIGCKRETQTDSGKWMRCDSHAYSWCGNSYGVQRLKAGHFLAWTQACDTPTGKARPLRFKLYGQGRHDVVSNEGVGVVDEADVQFCRYDAMAMTHGPFEDIAAVATGKVQGGEGASISGRSDAIRGLERFPKDKRLFPVVKEVITLLKADKTVTEDRGGSAYTECLAVLQAAAGSSVSREEVWDYVNGQLHDPAFPWRAQALAWLTRAFAWEKDKLRPLLEGVLATAAHPALHAAACDYPKVVEKSVAGLRLAALAADQARQAGDRQIAREAWETLFPNPYLLVTAQSGESSDSDGGFSPLKKVTLTNISPQSITLPVARPEALLVIEVDGFPNAGDQGLKRFPLNDEPGSLTIPAGQSVVMENVKWWQPLRWETFDPATYYSVYFLARTPGLWDVPARTNWGWSPSGEELLKTLKREKSGKQ